MASVKRIGIGWRHLQYFLRPQRLLSSKIVIILHLDYFVFHNTGVYILHITEPVAVKMTQHTYIDDDCMLPRSAKHIDYPTPTRRWNIAQSQLVERQCADHQKYV
jgi:hypothetical protein